MEAILLAALKPAISLPAPSVGEASVPGRSNFWTSPELMSRFLVVPFKTFLAISLDAIIDVHSPKGVPAKGSIKYVLYFILPILYHTLIGILPYDVSAFENFFSR